jgi:hypothetical protein
VRRWPPFAGTGRALRRDELARNASGHGADPAAVLAELANSDVIVFDACSKIRAATRRDETRVGTNRRPARRSGHHPVCAR